jgi:hypothetical protein
MDTINSWLESFPYHEAKARVETLQSKKIEIDSELMRLMQFIQLYEQEHPSVRAGRASEGPKQEGEPVRTLRQALLTVMDGVTPMRLSDVRLMLVKRGWLSDSDKDYHRLQMMASNMVKAGQLKRPEQGLYVTANGSRQEAIPMR